MGCLSRTNPVLSGTNQALVTYDSWRSAGAKLGSTEGSASSELWALPKGTTPVWKWSKSASQWNCLGISNGTCQTFQGSWKRSVCNFGNKYQSVKCQTYDPWLVQTSEWCKDPNPNGLWVHGEECDQMLRVLSWRHKSLRHWTSFVFRKNRVPCQNASELEKRRESVRLQ